MIGGGWSPGITGWPTGGGEMVGGWILGRKDGPPAEDVCCVCREGEPVEKYREPTENYIL